MTSVSSLTILSTSTTVMPMPTPMAITRSKMTVSAKVMSIVATAPREAVLHTCAKLRQPDML